MSSTLSPLSSQQPFTTSKHHSASPPPASALTCSEENAFPCPQDADHSLPSSPAYAPADLVRIQFFLRHFVPTELADMIMKEAELFPYVEARRNAYTAPRYALEAADGDAQWCYLVSPSIPSLTRNGVAIPTKVHKVKFFIKAYRSQWKSTPSFDFKTWFEAGVLRPEQGETYTDGANPTTWYPSLTPCPKFINTFVFNERQWRPRFNPLDHSERVHVITNPQHEQGKWHEIEWSSDDIAVQPQDGDAPSPASFVKSLKVGDRVMLFARAQNPGWIDQIFHTRMEIVYSLDSKDST